MNEFVNFSSPYSWPRPVDCSRLPNERRRICDISRQSHFFWGGCSCFSCDVGCGSKRDTQSDSRASRFPCIPAFLVCAGALTRRAILMGYIALHAFIGINVAAAENLTGSRMPLRYCIPLWYSVTRSHQRSFTTKADVKRLCRVRGRRPESSCVAKSAICKIPYFSAS